MAGALGTVSRGHTGAENSARFPARRLSSLPSLTTACPLSLEAKATRRGGLTLGSPRPTRQVARGTVSASAIDPPPPSRGKEGHTPAPRRTRLPGAGWPRTRVSGSRGDLSATSIPRASGDARPVLATWERGSGGSASSHLQEQQARDLHFLSEIFVFTFVNSKLEN